MVKKWQKIIDKTPNKDSIDNVIDKIIGWDVKWLDIMPIVWKPWYLRCRIWKFRIVFTQDENKKTTIVSVGYRWDIYKNI